MKAIGAILAIIVLAVVRIALGGLLIYLGANVLTDFYGLARMDYFTAASVFSMLWMVAWMAGATK